MRAWNELVTKAELFGKRTPSSRGRREPANNSKNLAMGASLWVNSGHDDPRSVAANKLRSRLALLCAAVYWRRLFKPESGLIAIVPGRERGLFFAQFPSQNLGGRDTVQTALFERMRP